MTEEANNRDMYRGLSQAGELKSFSVRLEQTDLFIRAEEDFSTQALDLILEARTKLNDFMLQNPKFLTSFSPLEYRTPLPGLINEMSKAGEAANVGPMAAVAGGIAEYVGKGLLPLSPRGVIVENGGDIFLCSKKDLVIGLFAGSSPLSLKIGLNIRASSMPLGLCTSSATVGHSTSFGHADAAVILAKSTALADAAATSLGNRITSAEAIPESLEWALGIEGVIGALGIVGEKIGLKGDLELVQL